MKKFLRSDTALSGVHLPDGREFLHVISTVENYEWKVAVDKTSTTTAELLAKLRNKVEGKREDLT